MHKFSSVVLSMLVFAAATTLSGCAVGPDYHRPDVSVPATWSELPHNKDKGWVSAEPEAAAKPKGNWWTVFHDPLLDRLEPMVSVSNQTVRADYANYQQAVAEVRSAHSALFPTLGATGSLNRQHDASDNTVENGATLQGNISWDPDLWGEVRRNIEENTATAQASEATLANATLSAQVALATAVINLRVTDANIDLLRRTVAADQRYLQVVSNQEQAGTAAPSELVSAQTQLMSEQADLISLGVARAQYAHAIAVLVGKNPEDLSIPYRTVLPTLPIIPVGVPSTLLQRRPDIAIAERQMAAANAAIGVATAAYYPSISLSAIAGFTQSPLAGLLNVANYMWSLGSSAAGTIFDAGQRRAEVASARAAYDASVANYRGTVLNAFENVENDLSGLRILAQQAAVLDTAVRTAKRGTRIARDEYQAGTVDYTTVVDAQTDQLSDEQSALDVQQQRLLDAVSLIGDLGGGWSADELYTSAQGGKPSISQHVGD